MILDRFRRKPAQPAAAPPSLQEIRITNGLASLREASARDIMTPRVDVDAIPAPVSLADAARAVRRSGHSHFPVFKDDLDHLIGVLFVKDLFHLDSVARPASPSPASGATDGTVGSATADSGTGAPDGAARSATDAPGNVRDDLELPGGLDVTDRLREPYVVPESRSALEILADMRQRRRGFAVVVDEHGGFAGVLTVKDLVSELVGDLHDEFDRAVSPAVVRIDATRFLVDGSCAVGEVREATGAEIPDGEYVTLGGFLFDAFGHIPSEGEVVERGDWSFRVARMDRRRVAKVVVQARSATISAGHGDSRGAGGK